MANPVNPAMPGSTSSVDDQVANRWAGFHAQGIELATRSATTRRRRNERRRAWSGPAAAPPTSYFAEKEGTFLVTSHGATFGGEGPAGNSGNGMFAVSTWSRRARSFYRSQVTEEEMRLCTTAG